MGLGRGNCRLLCEEARIAYSATSSESDLSAVLLRESDQPTLIHLKEFSKRRTDWIEKVFATVFTKKKQQGLETNVMELGTSSSEKLKVFTKLLLIYRRSPKALLDIFIYETWYRRSTHFEYAVGIDAASTISGKITRKAKQLSSRFTRVTRYGISLLSSHELPDGLCVWVFLREYPARIRRDFRTEYNVSHDCGLIVLGFDPQDRKLHFRSGNKQLALALCEFVVEDLEVHLESLRAQVFSDYDPEQVRTSLMGEYQRGPGIEIVEAAFARTSLPGRGPLVLRSGFMQSSIREDLKALNSVDISCLDLRSAADLDWLVVSFSGRLGEVRVEVVKGGAVRLNFENAGWNSEEQREFEAAFLDTFGLPLNKLIDPSIAALGEIGIVGYLLNISTSDEVEGYHEEIYQKLLDKGILCQLVHNMRGCRNNICQERLKPVGDDARQNCIRCDQPLEDWTVTGIERNQPALFNLVRDTFIRATGLELEKNQRVLSRQSYYRLTNSRQLSDDQALCIQFADRPTESSRFVFERASLPMVVIRPTADSRKVFVDLNNVGHVSLSYLIAAQDDPAERDTCDALCKTMVARLLMTHRERLEKAARHSYQVLTGDRTEIDGDSYEDLIFNLLRVIVPYSFRLGRKGKEEPDGFVSIPDYRGVADIVDVGSWNFTYDAKFSAAEAGYDFGASERRQMLHYISSFSKKKKVLVGKDGKNRAHVIISNNITPAKVAAATNFLYGKNGLSGSARDVQFVLMQEEFIVTLFAWMQSHVDELNQKRPYLYEAILNLLGRECKADYLSLGAAEANEVIETVSQMGVIEKRIEPMVLKASLHDSKSLI